MLKPGQSVEDMWVMFHCARRFNRDLSQWDVRGVRNMYCMFSHALSFDQDLSRWEVRGDCEMFMMFHLSPLQDRVPEWCRQ